MELYREYFKRRDDPRFAELTTAILNKQAKERKIFLTWICAEEPEGYEWYPQLATCERYLGTDYKNNSKTFGDLRLFGGINY